MKLRIFTMSIISVLISISCIEQKTATEIIPIQDNPNPRTMARGLFPEAPDSLISALGLEDGIPSSVCAFLAKADGKNILFDAANGAPDSRLMHVLDSCEVSAEGVDYIFITHLHGDHIGGLLKEGVAVFSDADLYINEVEYNAWKENDGLRAVAKAYGSRLKTFSVTDKLPCGIEAIEAYGHTAGHTAYKLGESLIVGDIMHGVALQLEYPQYSARFDMDKDKAVETRKTIMKMARDNGLTVYGMHFPAPYHIR